LYVRQRSSFDIAVSNINGNGTMTHLDQPSLPEMFEIP
jgi:hypothetical protein